MSINANGTGVESVIVDGAEVDKVIVDGVTVFEKFGPYNPEGCISFVFGGAFTLTAEGGKQWDGIVEYSTDAITWAEWDGATQIDSSENGILYLRGNGNTKFYNTQGTMLTPSQEVVTVYGNMMTLLQYDDPPTVIPAERCFMSLFSGVTIFFAGRLPATVLKAKCYQAMFKDNKSETITDDFELPATELAEDCYYAMFLGAYVRKLPKLPATVLAPRCYYNMFNSCFRIKLSTTQDSTYKTAYRIPANGTGTTADSALYGMFVATSGSFKGAPEINTTYYGTWD